jgi:hypothetical protein
LLEPGPFENQSIPSIADLLNFCDMVNTAVINDKNTARSWVWIHLLDETFEPEAKLFAIVSALFDMVVDQAITGESRKYRISRITIRII